MATKRKTPIKYKRGKSLPRIQHGDVIDMTTFPLHSKPDGRPIEMCPKCGRKGEMTTYKGEPVSYTHTKEFQTIFWFVRESCSA
jgi:hypothetical protein